MGAAADVQCLPRYVPGVVGGQERHRVADVFSGEISAAKPPLLDAPIEQLLGREAFGVLRRDTHAMRDSLLHGGPHAPRADGVHINVEGSQLEVTSIGV